MTDPDTERRHEIALFRYGLIADLAQLPPGTKGLYPSIRLPAAGGLGSLLQFRLDGG